MFMRNELMLAHLLQNKIEELTNSRPKIYFGGLTEDKYSFLGMLKSFIPCLYKETRFLNSLSKYVYIEAKKCFCEKYDTQISENCCNFDFLSSDLIINTEDKLFIIEYVGGVHYLYDKTYDRDIWLLNMEFKKMFIEKLSSYNLDKKIEFIIVEEEGEEEFIENFSKKLTKYL